MSRLYKAHFKSKHIKYKRRNKKSILIVNNNNNKIIPGFDSQNDLTEGSEFGSPFVATLTITLSLNIIGDMKTKNTS